MPAVGGSWMHAPWPVGCAHVGHHRQSWGMPIMRLLASVAAPGRHAECAAPGPAARLHSRIAGCCSTGCCIPPDLQGVIMDALRLGLPRGFNIPSLPEGSLLNSPMRLFLASGELLNLNAWRWFARCACTCTKPLAASRQPYSWHVARLSGCTGDLGCSSVYPCDFGRRPPILLPAGRPTASAGTALLRTCLLCPPSTLHRLPHLPGGPAAVLHAKRVLRVGAQAHRQRSARPLGEAGLRTEKKDGKMAPLGADQGGGQGEMAQCQAHPATSGGPRSHFCLIDLAELGAAEHRRHACRAPHVPACRVGIG